MKHDANLFLNSVQVFGPVLAPIFIGIAIGIGIFSSGTLISSGYSGAAMNPARCFGPAAVTGTSASFDGIVNTS